MIVANANSVREIESIHSPPTGNSRNATKHIFSGATPRYSCGWLTMLPTAAIPVIAHNTTVSQNGPVMEINACRTAASFGLSEEDAAVAATIGIEPSPASLVNNPRGDSCLDAKKQRSAGAAARHRLRADGG